MAEVVDWSRYRKCPVCSSETGEPCVSLRSLLLGSGPVEQPLDIPHTRRWLRAGYARTGGSR